MGQSTDAILCWGIDLGEDEAPWADRAEELGHDDPYDDEAIAHILTGEKLKWREASAKLEELGIELIRHCYHEYPMYIIAAAGFTTTANRGTPEEIVPASLAVPVIAEGKFAEAAKKLGLEEPETAKWLLCSDWG